MIRRSHRGLTIAAGVVLLMPAMAACGGGSAEPVSAPSTSVGTASSAAPSEPAASEPAASEPAASEPAASEPAAVAAGIPDPCALLAPDELTALTGADNGEGKASGSSPDVRRVCIYPTGLVTSVNNAAAFEAFVAVVRSDKSVEDISEGAGPGERAVITTYNNGAVTQVAALQGSYFVTVTGVMDPEQATATAQAMLDAV